MESPQDEPLNGAEFIRWLADARQGNRDALGQLFDSARRYLLWLASHELGQDVKAKQGASDVVQETFVRAQAGLEGFQGRTEQEFKAWLRKILLNNLANTHRQYRRTAKRAVSREIPLPGENGTAVQTTEDLKARDHSPSSVFIHNEENRELLAAIERLPADYQQVLTLRHWNRLPFEEIGKLMDRSANAARKLWVRAFERLEHEMGCQGNERT